MQKFTRISALVLAVMMLFGMLSAAAEGTSDAAAKAQAQWTVMLYLCGTDLESEGGMATTNLEEIAKTRPNDNVNIVIQTGGTDEWHAQDLGLDIDPDKTQRYHYDENGYTLDEELPLQNMSNANTLNGFIRYCAEKFPADKYLLVLWDHGGGSNSGLIVDQKFNDSIMSLDQLELAVKSAGVQLEAVLLDTCLMASLETAQCLQGMSHYLIASEETVPGKGSDYYAWLQYLYDMPECSGKLFGRRVCDSIQQKYVQLDSSYDGLTFSVIDLTQLDPVTEAFNALFAELRTVADQPAYMNVLGAAIRRTENYQAAEMIDLGDLAEKTRGLPVSNKTANALLTALGDAVVHSIRGVHHSYSSGLSFYYNPAGTSAQLDHYARIGKNPEYLAFLDQVNTSWSAPSWVYSETEYRPDVAYEDYLIKTVSGCSEEGTFELQITNAREAVGSINLAIFAQAGEDTWIRLCKDPFGVAGSFETGSFTADISGKLMTIGGVQCEMQLIEENSEYNLYQIPVQLIEAGVRLNMYVMYTFDNPQYYIDTADASFEGSYEILGFASVLDNALPSRTTYSVHDLAGMTLMPLFTEVSYPDGSFKGYTALDVFEFDPGMELEEVELDPDFQYAAAFYIKDVFGRLMTTELATFTFDGETALFAPLTESEETEEDEAEEAESEEETEAAA